MTYSQVFTDFDDYLLCITDGEVTDVDSCIKWAMAVIERSLARGHTKLLCDNRTFRLKLTQIDVTKFADHLEEIGAARLGIRIAVISCPENAEVSRMVETALTNRSGSYKTFKNQEAAKKWLL